jgi:signal transduction histidine kinase
MSAKDEWLGSVVVYHDITREEMADRLKSELVATASHELRTPLTSMRGYVDMLMLDTFGPLNPSQRDFLRIVKNNVTRLVHLVDELLDMSRVEAGEVRLRREEVDLVEMFYETSQSLHGQFNERNVTLHMDLQDNLPVVLADRQRLQQILINLVGNACKYTEPGGQVDIALYNGGDKLRVDVRDTGVGIPEDAKPHIFTPFYRAENPLRDEVGGTGLGLSITRKLVEMHGGEIWFESAEGKGSTFSFTLPLSSYQSTAQ